MKSDRIQAILQKITSVRVAVYGDFCLDAYWILHPNGGEISVETGKQAQAVHTHYYSLGGASNVVANLAALSPAEIHIVGAVGDDLFGRELIHKLKSLNVHTELLVTQNKDFDTPVFGKRYIHDEEEPRIDFGFFNSRTRQTDDQIIANLRHLLPQVDALIFNQQIPGSLSDYFIQQANTLFQDFSDKIIIMDSRHYGNRLSGVMRKMNAVEAAHLCGKAYESEDTIPLTLIKEFCKKLYDQDMKSIFLTRGAHGILVHDKNGQYNIPGLQLMKKLDTVGAGDTVISALAASLGSGVPAKDAAAFANLAAGVTVQKLFMTGTANPQEIQELAESADYIYEPELAANINLAEYVDDGEIEHIRPVNMKNVKHVIFENDGTISTLREGWDVVMARMMFECIVGERKNDLSPVDIHKVKTRVNEYISLSAGIQTILQMQELVAMIKEFGFVSENNIQNAQYYKKLFGEMLMQKVNKRIAKLKNGELSQQDFIIKSADIFLQYLSENGFTLYLASGTDHDDVVNEATILGYADYFNGGIYGAVGDISKFSKKQLVKEIMEKNSLSGEQLAVFGDGPVEIREVHKNGGVSIGVAGDEKVRFGLNPEKRARLIKAGADFIIPDFTQWEKFKIS